ncbi:MAG TPA: patatin-like phospholipase family protein [Terriglobales bacterium]|nr:patatin-like phospholipase family protein [Terriglobales bacterium]
MTVGGARKFASSSSFGADVARLLKTLGYLYVLRVPFVLFVAALLLTLGGFSEDAPANPLLRGVYDVGIGGENEWINLLRFAFLTVMTLLFGASLTVSSWITLTMGNSRFRFSRIHNTPGVKLVCILPNLFLVLLIFLGCSLKSRLISAFAGNIAGILAFLLLIYLARQLAMSAKRIITLLSPIAGVVLATVLRRDPLSFGILFVVVTAVWLATLRLDRFIPGSRRGYVDSAGRVLARHNFAALLFIISLALYSIVWLFKSRVFNPASYGTYPVFPTLAMVLLLGILLCWTFSGITFFLDRYRVPVFLPIALYATFTSSFPQSDHFYRGLTAATGANFILSPKDILEKAQHKPVIVVAVTGGGIQAAAWSARVLRGLQLAASQQHLAFADSVRLISAVSGGSVGAMYFLRACHPPKNDPCGPHVQNLESDCVVQAAQSSSLDEIASALVYEDLVLNLFPFLKGLDYNPADPLHRWRLMNGRGLMLDRGNALENSLKRGAGLDVPLLQWKADAKEGLRPAVIFNATLVENGERLLLSTTDLDDQQPCTATQDPNVFRNFLAAARARGRIDFHHRYCNADVPVATAVRLSATFPYVSPAARILQDDLHQPAEHVVDGGYFDAYGMASLGEWMDRGLTEINCGSPGSDCPPKSEPQSPRILVLQIRSSPPDQEAPPGNERGFLFQTSLPATTLLKVRGTGQLSHNELELNLIRQRWGHQNVCSALFQYVPPVTRGHARSEPLSWHLTPEDVWDLRQAWNKQTDVPKVLKFLKGEPCPD